MKIEIDLDYVEHLKSNIERLEKENRSLSEKISELSETELKKKAVRLSFRLLNKYIETIFTKLGFDQKTSQSVVINYDVNHYLGDRWWESDRIFVTKNASVMNEFRMAYLNIGISTRSESEVESHKDDNDIYNLNQN